MDKLDYGLTRDWYHRNQISRARSTSNPADQLTPTQTTLGGNIDDIKDTVSYSTAAKAVRVADTHPYA